MNVSKMVDMNWLFLCVLVVVVTAVMFGEAGISPGGLKTVWSDEADRGGM